MICHYLSLLSFGLSKAKEGELRETERNIPRNKPRVILNEGRKNIQLKFVYAICLNKFREVQ